MLRATYAVRHHVYAAHHFQLAWQAGRRTRWVSAALLRYLERGRETCRATIVEQDRGNPMRAPGACRSRCTPSSSSVHKLTCRYVPVNCLIKLICVYKPCESTSIRSMNSSWKPETSALSGNRPNVPITNIEPTHPVGVIWAWIPLRHPYGVLHTHPQPPDR